MYCKIEVKLLVETAGLILSSSLYCIFFFLDAHLALFMSMNNNFRLINNAKCVNSTLLLLLLLFLNFQPLLTKKKKRVFKFHQNKGIQTYPSARLDLAFSAESLVRVSFFFIFFTHNGRPRLLFIYCASQKFWLFNHFQFISGSRKQYIGSTNFIFQQFFIKNRSYDIIHTFINYFITVFLVSVFNFNKNKLNSNEF